MCQTGKRCLMRWYFYILSLLLLKTVIKTNCLNLQLKSCLATKNYTNGWYWRSLQNIPLINEGFAERCCFLDMRIALYIVIYIARYPQTSPACLTQAEEGLLQIVGQLLTCCQHSSMVEFVWRLIPRLFVHCLFPSTRSQIR